MSARAASNESDSSAVPPEVSFREAMSHLVSGVCAVTAAAESRPIGLTVSSVTSFSDVPPSVSFVVATSARSYRTLMVAERVGVHILAADQRREAEVLAGRSEDKFASCDWEWVSEVPRLRGALAFLLCHPAAMLHYGDHSLVVAEVERVQMSSVAPMVYLRRRLDWRLAMGEEPTIGPEYAPSEAKTNVHQIEVGSVRDGTW